MDTKTLAPRGAQPLRCVSLTWRPNELALRFSDGNTRVAELIERRTGSGRWRTVLRLRDLQSGTTVERRGRGVLGVFLERMADRTEDRWFEVDALREEERLAMLDRIRIEDDECIPSLDPARRAQSTEHHIDRSTPRRPYRRRAVA
jgi:hypothetical protein